MSLGNEYLRIVQERFKSVKDLGDKTLRQLSDDNIHWALNECSNNVVVIVKHLSGNMTSRWSDFLTTDGEKPNRHREQEFEDTISSKQDLLTTWEKGWTILFDSLRNLGEQDLLKKVSIRGESHIVLEAIERQLAHYAYHIGQLVFIGKLINDGDWESLSIPRGQSEDHLHQMLKRNR
jgi:hypothetical protein